MGLNSNRAAELWKDRAMVELNLAVLHSFEKEGVTIVDHHTASSQFTRFVANEERCGRAVTGDWSWLVPPIAGSTCPVFHQSMDHTQHNPTFSYQ
jgi:nitric-oxide synthase